MNHPKTIAVIIPTANRPEVIHFFLQSCVTPYVGNLFAFYLFDGSDGQETKEIVEKFNQSSKAKIQYFHCNPTTSEEKIEIAYSKISSPFYYILGDGILLNFSKFGDFLEAIDFQKYSVLNFDFPNDRILKRYLKYQNNVVVDYPSPLDFVSNCSVPMVLFGGSIISDETKKLVVQHGLLTKYNKINSDFGYTFSVFDAIKMIPNPLFCFFYCTGLTGINPYKKGSGWYLSGRVIDTFCRDYYESIQLLDPYYNPIKKTLLKIHWQRTYLPTFKNLIRMRSKQTKNVSFKIVHKYRFYIKRTIPFWFRIYLSLLIPSIIPTFFISIHRKKANRQ